MHLSALAPWTRNFPLPQILTGSQSSVVPENHAPDPDAGLRHDLGNLMTALRLCADLMTEPDVLASSHAHLGQQLKALVQATERLTRTASVRAHADAASRRTSPSERRIGNLGQTVRELGPLLSAIAGPRVDVQVACMPCPGELRLSEESLSRILMNLVRNAADALPSGGKIRVTVQRGNTSPRRAESLDSPTRRAVSPKRRTVLLTVADNGPGIPPDMLGRIFEPGFSTRRSGRSKSNSTHRGLGLSVARQLLARAGGSISVQNGAAGGARFLIELPLTNVTPCLPPESFSRAVKEAV